MANRDLTRPGTTLPASCHIDNIRTISTTKYLDDDLQGYPDDAVDDIYADGGEWSVDQRWRPVAAIAGIVFVLAVIASVVIVNGGDSASTSATVVVPPSHSMTPTPRTALPPETATTVAPRPTQPSPTATSTTPDVPPPVAAPPPDTSQQQRTFTYRVTGTKGLLDIVTIVYTDAQGAPQTDFNVSLPWSRTVVMNPGTELRSVVATSLTGHLNCSITDGVGQPITMSTSSAMIATCAR